MRFIFGSKASAARIVSTQFQINQAVATPANYENFAEKGYNKNQLVYVCIHKIATSCAGIEWDLYKKKKGSKDKTEIEESPLIDLLDRPNPMQARAAFIESVIAYYLLAGNSYIEQVKGNLAAPPVELWSDRPDRMKIIGGINGYPRAYQYTSSGKNKLWEVDFVNMKSDILHLKTFHPTNDWYGLSPLQVAMMQVDQSNAGNKWNLSMLQNSATPSGVLQMEQTAANPRGNLTDEQFARLKKEMEENYQGSRNTGRPMLLEGGLKWQQMSISPKDMDFIKGAEVTEHAIAKIFGVPGEIIGLGKTIYNNYEEARCAFYEETILPLMDYLQGELNRWLVPQYGEGMCLEYDKDDIEALQYKRQIKMTMLKDANFLTQNEKREAAGYEESEGWDVFVINNQIGEVPEDFQNAGGTGDNTQDPSAQQADEANQGTQTEETPKKPDQSQEDTTDENADETDDGKSVEFKLINAITKTDKLGSWKAQNRFRERLIKSMAKDLEYDFKRMSDDIGVAAKSSKDPRTVEYAVLRAVDTNSPHIKRTLEKHNRQAIEQFGQALLSQAKKEFNFDAKETKAKSRKFDDFVNAYVRARAGESITQIEGTSRKEVMRLVRKYTAAAIADSADDHFSLSDFADELQSDFEGLSKGRANTIARTETGAATSRGSLEAAKALDVPGLQKEWISAEDDRVRDGYHGGADHVSANGLEVEINEKFTIPPDASMDCPLDSAGGADQVCNCRCVLVYKSKRGNEE